MIATLQRAAATARWALRAHAPSTVRIVLAGAIALGAALPVLWLGGAKLSLRPLTDAGFAIVWSTLVSTPTVLRQQAIATLSGILVGLAIAALAVAAMTVLALSVSRAAARRSEIVVRRAVGASRRQLVTSGLIEGVAMGAVALAVGVPTGAAAARAALAGWPGSTAGEAGVAALVTGLAIAGLILAGALFPIYSARRTRRVVASGASSPALAVSAIQLGICLAILVAAAQLARRAASLTDVARAPAGATGQVYEVDAPTGPAERAGRFAALLDELRAGKRFDLVSLSSPGALVGLGTVDFVVTDCGNCAQGGIKTPLRPVLATVSAVSRDTFRAMGVTVLRGRGIADTDRRSGARVAVVGQRLAARHFEGGVAVGRKILVGRGPDDGWYTVVGVVDDRGRRGFGAALQSSYAVYLSVLQQPPSTVEVLVRPGGPLLAGAVRESDHLAREARPLAWFARLVGLEGFVVLAIAVAGTFALMQLWVTALAPELAVRRALGARRRHVLIYVLVRAIGVAVAGVAVGLWLDEMTSDALAAVLGVGPRRDLALVARPALALVAAALAGALLPAWRAARKDPAVLMAALDGS